MKGTSKLSLAIALALIGSDAFALGLGAIQVRSKLNQPLDAVIPVVADSAAEAGGLNVNLASADDFQRVGLNRARVSMPIDFSVTTDSRGQPVIKVTTKDAVREPFLDFLVEVNWPKGKLLREYTVLLDPPVMAPATHGAAAAVSPVRESAPAQPQKLATQPGHAKPQPVRAKPTHPVAAETKPTPAASHPSHTAAAGQYGPVASGETLSEVARATRPDDANLNEMMLALLKANPNAFYRDNINALKRGAILRIPSHDEIKASGSALAAAAAVREQNQAWGANVPLAKPTLVAKTGAPSTSPGPSKPGTANAKSSEHLALVPPRAGKGGQATADQPGPASGTGAASAETKAELARTKEALASREQEASDLKSRVKQLEDLNSKDQRLITLKQSEIAELQNKLKELEAAKGAVAAAAAKMATNKPAETPAPAKPAEVAAKPGEAAAKSDAKLTAKDIWGDISGNEKTAPAKSSIPAASTPAAATPEPAASGAAKPPEVASKSALALTSAPTGTPPPPAVPPAATAASATSPVVTPSTSAPEDLSAKPAPAPAAKPAKPVTPPKVAVPPMPEQPWYMNNSVLLGGGGALLLIGLLALMRFMRKPKPVLLPVTPITGIDEHAGAEVSEDEHHLLDELAQRPGDAALSLELLNLYYTQHDADKFEAAAEAMYAHLADPAQPEWQQVRAMGEELCPHNPLFGGHDDFASGGYAHADHAGAGHEADHLDTGLHAGDGHAHDDHFDLGRFDAAAKPADEENFDFDLTDHAAAPAHIEAAHEPMQVSAHPTPPPPAYVPPAAHEPEPVAAAKPAEDFFAGEDAIGTKLDLAKAYLDMGDPEGARSMLDEVIAEGNEAQKGEARKLLAEIR
jgi:pilus assembly protein FimV